MQKQTNFYNQATELANKNTAGSQEVGDKYLTLEAHGVPLTCDLLAAFNFK